MARKVLQLWSFPRFYLSSELGGSFSCHSSENDAALKSTREVETLELLEWRGMFPLAVLIPRAEFSIISCRRRVRKPGCYTNLRATRSEENWEEQH